MLAASTGAEVTCLSASRVKGLGQLEDTLRQVQQLVKAFINLYIKKPLQLLGGEHVKVESGWPDYKIDIEATFGLWATAAVWRGLPAAHHTQQAQPMQLLGASWLQVSRPCQSRAQATKCWCCCRSREHLIAHPDFRIHTGRTCVMGVSACTWIPNRGIHGLLLPLRERNRAFALAIPTEAFGWIDREIVFYLSRTVIPKSHNTCVSYLRFLAVMAGARTWQRTMPFLVLGHSTLVIAELDWWIWSEPRCKQQGFPPPILTGCSENCYTVFYQSWNWCYQSTMRFQVLYSLTSFPCLLKKDIKKGRKAIYIGIYTKEIAITFDLSIYLYLFSDVFF